ncbi:AraC family transcriptional regulator [Xanthomonas oryzae]|uniref:Helix-turn-helix domain-containing protein n=1 Tax=Xanthomonas oryzae pv. oryzae TaxID=64187 RepID=A0AAJ5MC80_XANOO|nr:helix-turn-helix transcriptional regulator [Xanthomonas oryzae]OLI92391.1 AraC family transcriptional regulator [Xanthomonas oryzae pv. oryzae]QIE19602.1 AraC family transcriptional regulator [Xanthomonas oryzae pv. oryzae]UXV78705.1 helix-turn-helix domain-containing protein [Xanthomonas oryzae pv. oryzae]UXW01326.1 helix-turn-helix domain-containing protein [Xanthomonas oryzae pv. oryzae]UXW15159.1 helix-turn-helix transcriptional regulator [Xanthomonas oryzae pv. oryzae]
MSIENSPTRIDALPPGVRTSFEKADGPVLIAFLAELREVWAPETVWHAHVRGQLMYVEHGMLTVHTEQGTLSLPPGCAGWLPPGRQHTVEPAGPMRGWGVGVRPDACVTLPAQGRVIRLTGLAREAIMRAASWPLDQPLDAAQQRLAAVLLDELRQVQIDHLHLPMPADRRLLRIARQLLDTPADPRSLEQWADWGGLSPRSLSRHFRNETGLSFAQWRQQARLAEGLRRLSQGNAMAQVADQLGYSSPSAFVSVFHRHFGAPPARYFASSHARGLASTAASG